MYKLELRDFILSHDNWEELLTTDPYNLKISRDSGYIMFKYNQLSSDFTIPLVREARGIVFRESDWKCVCFPFMKFGNYGESYCPNIDWNTASVQEKVDGSLIKLWYDNGWHISTNSTIDAFKAELNDAKYKTFGNLFEEALPFPFDEFNIIAGTEYVYMFELCSKYNRVVIPYDEPKLYLLGIRNIYLGNEVPPEESVMKDYFDIPKRYNLHSLEGWDDIQIVYSEGAKWSTHLFESIALGHSHPVFNYNQNNKHHSLSLGEHLRKAYRFIYKDIEPDCGNTTLEMATALHDMGKPFCATYYNKKGEKSDECHYYDHQNTSAYDCLFEKPLYNVDILGVSVLIMWHMRPYLAWGVSEKAKEKDKKLLGEELFNEILELHKADLAAH